MGTPIKDGLKPCPFCGSAELEFVFSGSQGFIECLNCEAIGPYDEMAADPHCDVQAAFDAWNKRAEAKAGV